VVDLSPLFVATFRDWVIIVMGIAVAAFFLVAMIITLVLGLLLRALLKKSNLGSGGDADHPHVWRRSGRASRGGRARRAHRRWRREAARVAAHLQNKRTLTVRASSKRAHFWR
jgi:hypothetical protein